MKRSLVCIVLFIVFLFSACSQPSKEDKNGLMEVGLTHGVCNPDPGQAVLTYTGTPIQLDYLLENREGRQRWGLQIYVDGVQQPFSVDGSSATTQYSSIFEEYERKTYHIEFTPAFGTVGDRLTINFIAMLNPDYLLPEPEKDSSYRAYHTITQIRPWQAKLETNIAEAPHFSIISMDETTKTSLPIDQKETDMGVHFNLYQGNELVNIIKATENDPLSLQIGVFGKGKITYRVSIYINHQIVPCFNGDQYIDMVTNMEEGQLHLYPIEINTSRLKLQANNSMYIIAAPILDASGSDGFPIVEKSRSLPLLVLQ